MSFAWNAWVPANGTGLNALKVGIGFDPTATGIAGLTLNNLTTTQRNALGTLAAGMLIWNTTTTQVEAYNGSTWGAVGVQLSGTNSWTGVNTYLQAGIGSTSSDAVVLSNTTAAANNAQQWSPRLRLTGQGWRTNATAQSQTVDWIVENQPQQGAANPTTNLVLSAQINGGGYNAAAYFLCRGTGTTLVTQLTGLMVGSSGAGVQSSNAQNNQIQMYDGSGNLKNQVLASQMRLASDMQLNWGNNADINAGSVDLILTRGGAATLQFGAADNGSGAPVAQTLQFQSTTNANSSGANATLIGSLSAGSGTSGDIIVQTGVKSGSSGVKATATTALTIKGETQVINVASAGSAANPSLGVGNITTGLYSLSTTGVGFAVNGVNKLDFGITSSGWSALSSLNASSLSSNGNISLASAGTFFWTARTNMNSPGDGVLTIWNNANTDFGRLQFGGTTASFPALKRSSATIQVRLADDSGFAVLELGAPKFSGVNTTGSGAALLGANSPSAHLSSPYTWIDVTASDGTACTMPIWQK